MVHTIDANGMIIADLIDAQILVELRRRLSYAEAAKALKLPPATLSRRVIKMEARAGLLLFERSTRAVSVTHAGELAATHAERLLNEAKSIDSSIENLRATPTGTVRVSSPVIFGQAIFGSILGRFLNKYPECSLHLELSDRHVDLIEESVDVVIRVGDVQNESLVVRPLGLVYAGLYRRTPDGRAKSAMLKSIDDLLTCKLGLLHPGAGSKPQLTVFDQSDCPVVLDVTPKLVCLNPWLLREAALVNDMVVVLPNIVARDDVATGRLERVLPRVDVRRTPIQLAFPSRRLMRPAVRAFIDLAAKVIPDALSEAGNE